jgi:5'-AMP-activated protein kinase regulatory beta subunit
MAKNGKKVESKHSGKSAFVCHSDGAQNVFLAGSFNDWDPTRTPMEPQGDGTSRVELELPPGPYEYKFVVDGAWCCEPGIPDTECAGCVPNPFGSMNRIIEVPGSAEAKESTGG